MVLLPEMVKPFAWATTSTWKTHILGIFVAFWVSFTLLGSNLLVAEKVGIEFVFGVLAFFCMFAVFIAGFTGLIAWTMSRKTILLVGLLLMVLGTIAINFVNSFGLFAMVYILFAMGFIPVFSVTGHLNHDFLGDNQKAIGRGRSCWGTLNYVSAACSAFAIPMMNHGWQKVWFATALAALVGAAFVLMFIKEEVAVKEQPSTEPVVDRPPFYQQLLTRDNSVQFSWQYVLVVAGSLAMRMCPVFFMEEWVAVAMIFCGELANGLCGPFQVRMSQRLEAEKNKATKGRIIQNVSHGTLVANFIALFFVSTGFAVLCIIGAVMIGVAVRVFTYLYNITPSDEGRGSYTFTWKTYIGHSLFCFLAMISMSMLGILMPLMLLTLIGIIYYNKVRLRNLISTIRAWRIARS